MSVSPTPEVKHPRATELALFATGDLPWRARVRLRWHLRRCRNCAGELGDLRHAIADVQEGRVREVTPIAPVLDWSVLERDMLGNIGVGLAAARCIEKVGPPRGLIWRGSLLIIVLSVLFVLGWLTHIPREQDEQLFRSVQRLFSSNSSVAGSAVVRAEAQQLGVGPEGDGLALHHPPAVNTSSQGDAAVDVRYLDDDTGQVTILRVSSAQSRSSTPTYGPR